MRILRRRSTLGIWADLAGRFTSADPAAEQISGYTTRELQSLTFMQLCASECLELTQEDFTRALQQSEELFRILTTLAPAGVYLTDHDGNCLYVNTAWCQMAGSDKHLRKGTR
jgi:PAS domain-containing protein